MPPGPCSGPPSPLGARLSSPFSPASDVSDFTNSLALGAALYELRHDLPLRAAWGRIPCLPLRDPPAVASSSSPSSCADATPPSSCPPSEPDLDAFALDAMADLAQERWVAAHLGEDSDRSYNSDSDYEPLHHE